MFNDLRLTATLLRQASEEFSNHGANEVSESLFEKWHPEYRKRFVQDFHKWNGTEDEFDSENLSIPDYALMSFLAHRLETKIIDDIDKLYEESEWLSYLEAAGVDNWSGYDYAVDLRDEANKED